MSQTLSASGEAQLIKNTLAFYTQMSDDFNNPSLPEHGYLQWLKGKKTSLDFLKLILVSFQRLQPEQSIIYTRMGILSRADCL